MTFVEGFFLTFLITVLVGGWWSAYTAHRDLREIELVREVWSRIPPKLRERIVTSIEASGGRSLSVEDILPTWYLRELLGERDN